MENEINYLQQINELGKKFSKSKKKKIEQTPIYEDYTHDSHSRNSLSTIVGYTEKEVTFTEYNFPEDERKKALRELIEIKNNTNNKKIKKLTKKYIWIGNREKRNILYGDITCWAIKIGAIGGLGYLICKKHFAD